MYLNLPDNDSLKEFIPGRHWTKHANAFKEQGETSFWVKRKIWPTAFAVVSERHRILSSLFCYLLHEIDHIFLLNTLYTQMNKSAVLFSSNLAAIREDVRWHFFFFEMTFLKHVLQDKKVGTQPQFHKKEKKQIMQLLFHTHCLKWIKYLAGVQKVFV